MTAHEQLQPSTAELAAKMIDGMGFEPIVAASLAEVVRLSLEEGRAAGKDECADRIASLTARVSELEDLSRFLLARLQEFDPGDFEAEREFHGHVAPAIARLSAALPPIPGEASR